VLVQYRIDITDGEFLQWEVRRLLLPGLRARSVSSRRDDSTIFLQMPRLNISKASTLNITVHVLMLHAPINLTMRLTLVSCCEVQRIE
jgi:hypothetical protein